MQVKKRQRRAYLKKRPAGKVNPYLMRDVHGNAGPGAIVNDSGPDWLDDLCADPRTQRVWINQQLRAQRLRQQQTPRPGVPKDIWYKTIIRDIPGSLVELWFSGTKYKIIEINSVGAYMSTIYHDREMLVSAHRHGTIIWDTIVRSEDSKC